MFYHIRGTVVLIEASMAVVEAGGVGYQLTVSQNTAVALSDFDRKEVRVFTHLAVREDGVELFGFYEKAELDAFRLLTSVSGVGPKAAMAILSLFTPDKLSYAIASEDTKAIARASGVGAKTAARIVLELHDKVSVGAAAVAAGATLSSVSGAQTAAVSGKLSEAQDALSVLGYSRTEIAGALREIKTDGMTVEQIITAALKRFSK